MDILSSLGALSGSEYVPQFLVYLAAALPLVGVLTVTTVRTKSHSLYRALATVAWDNKYLATGEVFDVSGILPNRCFGGILVATTVNDATAMAMFVQGASQAPATAVIQLYQSTTGAPAAFVEVANDTDVSARNGETWEIIGD